LLSNPVREREKIRVNCQTGLPIETTLPYR
jgi:hypothetical protein